MTPRAPKTQAERSAALYRRRLAQGWKQIVLWVKADKVLALRDFARKLREPDFPPKP